MKDSMSLKLLLFWPSPFEFRASYVVVPFTFQLRQVKRFPAGTYFSVLKVPRFLCFKGFDVRLLVKFTLGTLCLTIKQTPLDASNTMETGSPIELRMNNLRRRFTKMELADTGDGVGVSMVYGNNNYMDNVKKRSRTRYTNWKRLAT